MLVTMMTMDDLQYLYSWSPWVDPLVSPERMTQITMLVTMMTMDDLPIQLATMG